MNSKSNHIHPTPAPEGFVCTFPTCCKGNTLEPCDPFFAGYCEGPTDAMIEADIAAEKEKNA